MAPDRLPARSQKAERLPPIHGFAQRIVSLREALTHDAAEAGDQALKLLEEYLESLAQINGFQGEGGLGRYVQFLRARSALQDDLLDRAETYTQARNCLAHTYGLQASPALAAEVLDFVALLVKRGGQTAAQLMTGNVRAVTVGDSLARARDLMLRSGFGRLPVLRSGDGVVGVLTERDVVAAQATAERTGQPVHAMTVGAALPDDAIDRVVTVVPGASREQVAELLRQPGVVACLVTPHGDLHERPVGIITHADLLYRM